VHRDPQLAATGYFTETEDAGAYPAPTPVDRLPLRFSRTPAEQYRAPRPVGADNAAVLGEWLAIPEDDVRSEEAAGTLR
jgi:crotonobetainyl-CoA:carnitine CoA-transferase CaiB-like acyl-CoA transferase